MTHAAGVGLIHTNGDPRTGVKIDLPVVLKHLLRIAWHPVDYVPQSPAVAANPYSSICASNAPNTCCRRSSMNAGVTKWGSCTCGLFW